ARRRRTPVTLDPSGLSATRIGGDASMGRWWLARAGWRGRRSRRAMRGTYARRRYGRGSVTPAGAAIFARSACRLDGSTGLMRWPSQPAWRDDARSVSWPQPLTAMMAIDRPQG